MTVSIKIDETEMGKEDQKMQAKPSQMTSTLSVPTPIEESMEIADETVDSSGEGDWHKEEYA
jgi:hypothetical protein